MRSIPLENVSKKQTTSCGPLNCLSTRWNEEKDHPFCRRWRCWQQGRPDQQAYWKDELRYLPGLFFIISSVNKQLKQKKKKKKNSIVRKAWLLNQTNMGYEFFDKCFA